MQHAPRSDDLIGFGPFRFNKTSSSLTKQGTSIRIRGMPLKILQYMVDRPNELVSRSDLQRLLWSGVNYGDFEQGLNSAVNQVRRALNDSASQPRYIETVPGLGYRFIAPVCDLSTRSGPVESDEQPPPHSTDAISPRTPGPLPEVHRPEHRRGFGSHLLWWGLVASLTLLALGVGPAWRAVPKPHVLPFGQTPSANPLANDQFHVGMNFISVQNDIPNARKTFKRALEVDPGFTAARLQYVIAIVIEILNGYTNDEVLLYDAEVELHKAEKALPRSNGLLLAAQASVYLAQGRLDLVPSEQIERQWREGDDSRNPVWVAILRLLRGEIDESIAILRPWVERDPMGAPPRMFLGEALRVKGDTSGAIEALQRVLQQAPHNISAAWFLTLAFLDDGKKEEARALLQRLQPMFENNYLWRYAWALLLAAEGKDEEARTAMDEATLKFAKLSWSVTSTTADFYALLGDHTKAIEWLQLGIVRGDERVSYFRRNPRLSELRNDHAFQSVLSSVETRHTERGIPQEKGD